MRDPQCMCKIEDQQAARNHKAIFVEIESGRAIAVWVRWVEEVGFGYELRYRERERMP